MVGIPVHSGYNWAGWGAFTEGDGALSVSGDIATCSSGINTGRARHSKRFALLPGETLAVTVLAKRVSGADATSGGLAIDWPSEGALVTRRRALSSEWQEYSLEYTAPITATVGQFAMLSAGVFTSDGGEVQFAQPRVEIRNTQHGAHRVWGAAMIQMTAGTPTLQGQFVQMGISSLSYGSNTLSLQMRVGSTGGFTNPLPFVQMTPDTGTNALRLMPKADFNRTTGVCSIQFVDVTTGAVVNAATYGNFRLAVTVLV